MQLSNRIRQAGASGTVKVSQTVRELESRGKEVFELATGEPDFDTPDYVKKAAHDAALRGETRYTEVGGTAQLRDAIASKLRSENGVQCEPGNIVVGTGAKQLIFNALLATVNRGDEVLVVPPYWVSYPEIVRISEGRPLAINCTAGSGFKLTATQLDNHITSRTRWLILNSPCNPTGAVYSEAELRDLAEVLRSYPDVAVMCDDVYEKIVFDSHRFATMAGVAPDLDDRTLTVNGVSKAFAMTGWRIGYASGPTDLIAAMVKLQGQSTTNPSSISQAAALAALTGPRGFLEEWRLTYQRRRDLVGDRLSEIPGLSAILPEGAFYFFVDCKGLLGRKTPDGRILETDRIVCEFLLDTACVAVVPGSAFGCPGHFRLCFAKSDEMLDRACASILVAINSLE